MNRRLTGALAIGATALSFGQADANPGLSYTPTLSGEEPNFLLFLADDCTYKDIACYGGVNAQTPRIDAFAEEGMLFTNGYQAAPMSSPTRHNLYTGIWPVKSGAYPNHTFIYSTVKTVTDHFRISGYKVALFGKTHINPSSCFSWDAFESNSNDLDEGGDELQYIAYDTIDAFIKSCQSEGKPYVIIVASDQPHSPYNRGDVDRFNSADIVLPDYYYDTETTRTTFIKYLAEVEALDEEFGNCLDLLEDNGDTDDTVVLFLSEQGNSFPFAKWNCYDNSVHSAFICRWPGVVEAGSRSDAIVEYVDVIPTFVDIAGITPQGSMDGVSFQGVLRGETTEHKSYTFSLQTTRGVNNASEYYGIRSVANKQYRYTINLTPWVTYKTGGSTGTIFKDWLTYSDDEATWITNRFLYRASKELYDLSTDEDCMYNLLLEDDPSKYDSIVEELADALAKWMEYCGDEGQQTELDAEYHLQSYAMDNVTMPQSSMTTDEERGFTAPASWVDPLDL